ncbi:SNF2 family N-terminal domain-containing protein [Delphinella strobiligena]|nr:SNF2 family N-terminal domain-containing protein [Delphinella strobiligena]
MFTTPRKNIRSTKAKRILESDTMDGSPAAKAKSFKPPISKPDTARQRVRDEIATKTKAKRDAYILYHRDHFLPLLPESNYITKLEKSGDVLQGISPNSQLQSQPKNITATMKPYQLRGLSFLVSMYKNGMSCILGDEMGLGKTLQTLSLIQHLEEVYPSPPGVSRPYLVVCPLSVLESWYNECRKWTPGLHPMRFHGNKSEREHLKSQAMGRVDRFGNETVQAKNKKSRKNSTPSRRRTRDEDNAGFDILITTYEIFLAEQTWFKHSFVWRYIILDEGHKIKNEKSNVSHALQSLRAEHRLLLTGTPMQNNLREMWALLHWLFPDVFTDKTADNFANAFDLSKGKVSTSFMDDARRLLELVMIRRLKDSPGVDLGLPPKHEVLLYVPLTPMQRFWYKRLLTKAGGNLIDDLFTGVKDKEQKTLQAEIEDDQHMLQFEKAVDAVGDEPKADQWAQSRQIIQQAIENDQGGEKETSAYKKLLNLVMQLRKCCIHPYQIKGAAPDPYTLGDHVIHASGKFLVLSKLVDELVVKQKKKILIFSGFTHTLDYCENLLEYKGADQHEAPFRYLRLDGETARAKRNLDIRLFNDDKSEFKIMLISTKAGGLGLNLTAATEVVFLDEDWNPQVTLQAEARAHRIGQTKPVTIYKLCTQGTVEEQMMGRIRKKLYLSAKITESMRDIHYTPQPSHHKRKRGSDSEAATPVGDGVPQLGMSQLKSLVRRGATTLTHPEIDVNEMLSWDFDTILEKCKDRPVDPHVAEQANAEQVSIDEEEWLAKMERVECAVLDGVKYQRQVDADKIIPTELNRADRRVGKNTTVIVDGIAINKESLQCADWEAVPTMAGKDPRLAAPKGEKTPPITHQDHCQACHNGGDVVECAGCPRAYHLDCLDDNFKRKATRATPFYCSQHQCFECDKNTSDAGGLIYRCRWCHLGFCEDCLGWEHVKLLGGSLPEYDMLGYTTKNAWYVECHNCVHGEKEDPTLGVYLDSERARIAHEHNVHLKRFEKVQMAEIKKQTASEQLSTETKAGASEITPSSRDKYTTDTTTLNTPADDSAPTSTRNKGKGVVINIDSDSEDSNRHSPLRTEHPSWTDYNSPSYKSKSRITPKGFLNGSNTAKHTSTPRTLASDDDKYVDIIEIDEDDDEFMPTPKRARKSKLGAMFRRY